MFYLSQFKSVENRGFLLICVSLVTRGGVREKGETEKKQMEVLVLYQDPDLNEENPCIK